MATATKKVKIKVRKVTGFCCYARVVRRGKTLYETRDYPYGFDSNAYAAAESWAQDNGYEVE